MKIALGKFYHEANSFNKSLLKKDDFTYFTGQEALDHLFATEVFEKENAELVPLIYAAALPNGLVARDTYEYYAKQILEILDKNKDVDGIFLHLHGSMEVDGLGSGEYNLIKRIRRIVGNEVIIGLALDAHSNTDPRLPEMVNGIRNYRTVPHTDQDITERTVAMHMVDCIKNKKKTIPQFVRLPYAIHPEKALSSTWPLKEIFGKLTELEKRKEIAIASLGIGMVWCDCKTLASNISVTPSEEQYTEYAKNIAKELGEYVYSLRDSFDFDQLPLTPHEAMRYAIKYEGAPVYVSDSGDNTTGGGEGDHTIMLREFLSCRDYNDKKVLVTGIWDEKAVEKCMKYNEGDHITIDVGHNYDENTKSVTVSGILKKKGKLHGYLGFEDVAVGEAITITVGNVDFVILDRPGSFITLKHFKGAGLNIDDYQVIVVKQGYLFSELRKIAKLAILALTPGCTHQLIENLEYKNIIPPVYPLKYVGDSAPVV